MGRFRKQEEEPKKPEEEREEEKEVTEEETETKCPKCGKAMKEGTCESCGYKQAKKDAVGGEAPQEDTASATDTNSTVTTGTVLTAASPVVGAGPAMGAALGSTENHPTSIKLSADANFRKSPVGQYISFLEKKVEEISKKTYSKEDLEKMFTKWAEAKAPLRKALSENVGTETMVKSDEILTPAFEKRFRF